MYVLHTNVCTRCSHLHDTNIVHTMYLSVLGQLLPQCSHTVLQVLPLTGVLCMHVRLSSLVRLGALQTMGSSVCVDRWTYVALCACVNALACSKSLRYFLYSSLTLSLSCLGSWMKRVVACRPALMFWTSTRKS